MNKSVVLKDLVGLCWSGVLSPFDFLRATALCRLKKQWTHEGNCILSLLSFLSFLAALFFFVVSEWHFFYTMKGGVFFAVLFVACSCLRRFATADYLGTVLIGIMILLPDLIFGADAVLYKQFVLWFFLLVFWGFSSRRSGVLLLPLAVLNTAVFLYGVQFVLPSFQMEVDTFCILAALLNLFLLMVREIFLNKTEIFGRSAFRLVPLLFVCLFLLMGTIAETLMNNGLSSFLYCFIFTVAAGAFYRFKFFDRQAYRLILIFSILWVSLLLYCCVGSFALSVRQSRAIFFGTESLLIVGGIIWERCFTFRFKEDVNVD